MLTITCLRKSFLYFLRFKLLSVPYSLCFSKLTSNYIVFKYTRFQGLLCVILGSARGGDSPEPMFSNTSHYLTYTRPEILVPDTNLFRQEHYLLLYTPQLSAASSSWAFLLLPTFQLRIHEFLFS